jgi:hypothetical protein
MTDTLKIPARVAAIAPDGQLTPRQRRGLLLDLSRRKQKPGTGSSLAFMERRTAVNPWPDLRELLTGLDWVIVGGVATRAYMPERMTNDLDILVRSGDRPVVLERLSQAGYSMVSVLAIPGYLLRSPEGVELDVLTGDYPWLNEALANPEQDQAGYPVIRLAYLVLLKMTAARGRDIGDLTTMLGLASAETLADIRMTVARYSPEDRDDLETLIYLGRREMEPPQQSGS